jgi:hypothetical protein
MKAKKVFSIPVSPARASECLQIVIREFSWPILSQNTYETVVKVPPPGGLYGVKVNVPITIRISVCDNGSQIELNIDTSTGWSKLKVVGDYASGLVNKIANALEVEARKISGD